MVPHPRPVPGAARFRERRLALALMLAGAEDAVAGTQRFDFNQPAQPLSAALDGVARTTGVKLMYADATVSGMKAQPLRGAMSSDEALNRVLAQNGLSHEWVGKTLVAVKEDSAAKPAPAGKADAEMALDQVTVSADAKLGIYDPKDPYNAAYAVPETSTATRTDTPIMETPMSIQVVPKQVLRDQQAYRLSDVTKNLAGVQQSFIFGGVDRFIIRGFPDDNVRYRNGVRIPDLNVDLANVQQVEVLKGPSAGLYGRSQPGGLINIVTNRPLSEPYYYLEQRFGSYDYFRTQAGATGPISRGGNLDYRIDMSYLGSNSFREAVFNDRFFIAPTLSWKPLESTEVNLSVEYLNEDRPYDSGIPALGDRVAKVPISRQYDQPGLYGHRESVLVDLNGSHAFSENWKVHGGFLYLDYDLQAPQTYVGGVQTNPPTVQRYADFGGVKQDTTTVYLNLNGKFETGLLKHNVLVGGEYYSNDNMGWDTDDPLDTIDIFNPVFPQLDTSRFKHPISYFRDQQGGYYGDINNSWYGLYFQDQISLWEQFHLLGGGRYDWITVDSKTAYFSPLTSSSQHNERFSPRVGLVYEPKKWLSLYGSYTESVGSNNGVSQSGETFQPETGTQYEAGLKTQFFDGRLISTLAYYYLTKENTLTPGPNPNFRLPIGEARSQGVELDISGEIWEGLKVIATYAYTDTKITQDNSGNQGNRLPGVPLNSGSLWLTYDFQQEPLQGLRIGGGIYAAGRRYGDAANSFHDPGYARLDLFGAYRVKVGPANLTAQINLNNITDAEYFFLRNRTQNLPAEPLTVFGSLRLDY